MTALALSLDLDVGPVPISAAAVDALHLATAIYTVDEVVDEVLDAINWPATPGCLLDMGVGSGQFLVNATARLTLVPNDIDGLHARIEGWEIHPEAVAEARKRLVALLVSRDWTPAIAAAAAERVIIHADFLAPGPVSRKYGVVAGNPPYYAFGKLPEPFKVRYADAVPAYARRDLLHACMARAVEVLDDHGIVGLVTSDRWLINETCADLRAVIGKRFGIADVRRLESTSVFYRPKARRAGTPARVHPVAVVLTPNGPGVQPLTAAPIYPESSLRLTVGSLTPQATPSPTTTRAGNMRLVRGAAAPQRVLSDIASVALGPWLGTRGVFYLKRTDALAAGIPESFMVPCVEAKHLRGSVAGPTDMVALRTHGEEPMPPALLTHLKATIHLLRGKAAQRAAQYLPPESWGNLPLSQDCLVIPRTTKTVRTVLLPAGTLAINHNLSLITLANASVSLDDLRAAICTPMAQAWMERCCKRIDNDYFTLDTRVLRQMPIPDDWAPTLRS